MNSKLMSNSEEEAYYDRNQLAMLCAKMARMLNWRVRVNTEDVDWPVILIQIPKGQISYHIPREEMRGEYGVDWTHDEWDGHNLEEKRERIEAYLLEDFEQLLLPKICCTPDTVSNSTKRQMEKWSKKQGKL